MGRDVNDDEETTGILVDDEEKVVLETVDSKGDAVVEGLLASESKDSREGIVSKDPDGDANDELPFLVPFLSSS